MQTLIWKTLSPAQQADVLTRPALNDEADIGAVVKEIIAAVRSRGDEALRELSQRFERAPREQLRVSEAEIEAACARLDDEIKSAIEAAIAAHAYIKTRFFMDDDGEIMQRRRDDSPWYPGLRLFSQPAFAATDVWTKATEIMQDVYTQILAISTIAAIVTASVALLLMNFSRSGRTVDESRAWLKRICITWAVLKGLGFIMAYVTPLFSGGQWTG